MVDRHHAEFSVTAPRAVSPSTLPRLLRRPSRIYRRVKAAPPGGPRSRDVLLIACFLIAVAVPVAGMILHLDADFVLEENRKLAPRPELELNRATLSEFPDKFEAYFNDHFGFRRRLIYWLTLGKVALLGDSPSPKVILGRGGWLFYGDIDLQYYRAIKPLRPAQLEAWQRLLETRRDWLASRGIPYLIVFTPCKSTIYPEYMPGAYNRLSDQSPLDQLMAHLDAHSTLKTIDLRAPLRAEKSARPGLLQDRQPLE